ncbi:hypothetical protein KUTeg_005948 [Tegillarca granosa]|uniref:HIT-type domain-containing protein n=1 Tax=Tegillarca granosa TaxID=220873 RepID=A0ABQ9FF55_TEGGR|nr:hypothetical protein KUTeg_005948 [Tegillarca granosa]
MNTDEMACQTDEKSFCKICLKDESQYTCPRCNIQYCSVDCYKSEKHVDCSEAFYKDCFMEETATEVETIWNRLTEKEKKEFHKMTNDGCLGNLLQVWTPWWNEKIKPVEEIDETVEITNVKPKIVTDIPDITKLLTRKDGTGDSREFNISVLEDIIKILSGPCPERPLENERQSALSSDLKEVTDTKQKFEENWGGKVKRNEKKLIEEIT